MDLLRSQVQRRVFLDLLRVIGLPFGHLARPEASARLRQIFLAIEFEEISVGGCDHLFDDLTRFLPQCTLLERGDRERRHDRKRTPEGALFRVVDDIGGKAAIAPFKRHARYAEPARQAGAGIGFLFGEIARDIAHPFDIAPIFLLALQGEALGQIAPEIVVAVEGHFPLAEVGIADFRFEQVAENRRIDPALCRQGCGVDRVEPGKHLLGITGTGHVGFRRDRPELRALRGRTVGLHDLPVIGKALLVPAVGERQHRRVVGQRGRCTQGGKDRHRFESGPHAQPLVRQNQSGFLATPTMAGRSRRSLIL